MFKWFAPLLLFAGKPEVLLRVITLVIAGAILAFGVWLLSNVAVTFDTLKNPYIVATYGVVLACFFIGVGTVTWLRVRGLNAPARLGPATPVPEAPPLTDEAVSRRADEISRTWSRDSRRPAAKPRETAVAPIAAPPAAPKHEGKIRGSLTVTGPAYSGKTALIAVLAQATGANPPATSETVRLVDAGPADGDQAHLAAASAATTDGVLFVVDQDLRAPEVAAIKRLLAAGKPLYVVLNKADQFNAADRDAILVSIRAKMPAKFAPGHVVSVAGAPGPIEREIEDARGAVRLELRRPSSDIRALTTLLGRVFTPAPGRTLRFEAA
jgi:hypothetical protein